MRLFGLTGSVEQLRQKPFQPTAPSQALPGAPLGDRDKVNSARPMRTRFYSARSTRGGSKTAASGDCAEVNPTATGGRFPPARRPDPFHRNPSKQSATTSPTDHERQNQHERRLDPGIDRHAPPRLRFRRHGSGVQRQQKKRPRAPLPRNTPRPEMLLTHRRLGYPWSGCAPAEPASVSPSKPSLARCA
jgi:hypothetical protein